MQNDQPSLPSDDVNTQPPLLPPKDVTQQSEQVPKQYSPTVHISYNMVVLYTRDHGGLGMFAKTITQQPASQCHPGVLAVLVMHNQASLRP